MSTNNNRAKRTMRAKELLAEMALRLLEPKRAQAAYNAFDKEFRRQLLYTCTYLCKQFNVLCAREYAKDTCQDVLLKIYLNAEKYNPTKANPITWISTIARNEILNRLRNQVTFELSDDLSLEKRESIEEHFGNSVQEQQHNPLQEKLERALSRRSEREQDIIRITFLYAPGNIPSDELDKIAQRYGITKDYIKTLRKRGMDGLKGELDNECIE